VTTWTEVFRSADRQVVDDHALVLTAAGIGSGQAQAFSQHVLLVRIEDAERARAELAKYQGENVSVPAAAEIAQPIERSAGAAIVYVLILLAFDVLQRRQGFGIDWREAGMASAAAIQHGAWWRSVTALALHGDVLHLAGNAVFGAAFGFMLAQSIGFGMAWLGFVVTGGAGNEINAWLQAPSHRAIGASTAVFGMVGILAAHDWVRRRQLHYNVFRRWAPVAVGTMILAWLGGDARRADPRSLPDIFDVAMPRIDVGAHVLGFAVGLALGAAVGWARSRRPQTGKSQAALAGTAAALVTVAWILAIMKG
jgi:membrane associated rhomboid family serine protease